MHPTVREDMIVREATRFFARNGFNASTREFANEAGITQSLLYRYFKSKQELIGRVYDELTISKWNPVWEELIRDRGLPLEERLHQYYADYAKVVIRSDWIRIIIFAGLDENGRNERLFNLLKERIFLPIARESMHTFLSPFDHQQSHVDQELDLDIEVELVWALHASIFYLGMRKWVYVTRMPADLERTVHVLVSSFLAGMRQHLINRFTAKSGEGK